MSIDVEVICARPDKAFCIFLRMEEGATVRSAIVASGVAKILPDGVNLEGRVGIYGKPARLSQSLRHRDRIEIYRPLLVDPKEVRRLRAGQKSGLARFA